jgi:hypothetical protein
VIVKNALLFLIHNTPPSNLIRLILIEWLEKYEKEA